MKQTLSLMVRGVRAVGSAIGIGSRAFVALVGVAGITVAVANYAVTQGSGLNFGSVVVSSVHYAQQLICDVTTPAQCASVSAGGAVKVDGSAATQPVSSATLATAANQATEITSLATIATNTGAAVPAQSPAVPIGGVSICDGANGTTNPCTTPATVKAASTPAAATDKAIVVDQRPGTNVTLGPYPATSTPYTATATGTTGATTATLAGASSVTTYLCGFSIRANATAAATGNATVTGVITATLNFTQWTAPNASGLGITEMIFAPCIPASATNTSIAVVSAAPGTGGVVSVTAWGYKL